MQDSLATYRRPIVGVVVTLASLGVLLAILLPFRSHLSIAIPALALGAFAHVHIVPSHALSPCTMWLHHAQPRWHRA